MINSKRPLWERKIIQEGSRFIAPSGTFRESKRLGKLTYNTFMCESLNPELSSTSKALKYQAWKDAMVEEYQSILKNDVWDIVLRPKERFVVSSKWLFKVKYVADGSIGKHKAHFVARGFSQNEGIDFEETFAPVVKYTSIRAIIAIAVAKGWKIYQIDVKTAFLNGKIEEEVYQE